MRAILIALGIALALALPGAAHGQGLPPRPEPTAVPAPEDDDDGDKPESATGRITGTVIDLTTGAPAPGVPVAVGDATVTTDANGNYDRGGLTPGSYTVALALDPARGQAAQEPIAVALADGATVVQHLAFRSPAPTAAPAPEQPAALPPTGGADTGAWALALLAAGLIGAGARIRRR